MDRVGGLICLLINSLSFWERAGVGAKLRRNGFILIVRRVHRQTTFI